jgi:hypothetical protein
VKRRTVVAQAVSCTTLAVFVSLKLAHVTSWSWWWVLSPFWVPFTVAALILGGTWLVLSAKRERA